MHNAHLYFTKKCEPGLLSVLGIQVIFMAGVPVFVLMCCQMNVGFPGGEAPVLRVIRSM